MKFNFIIIFFSVSILILNSCKKNYTCACIDKVEDETGEVFTPKEDIIFENKKKREAKDLCKNENKSNSIGGVVYSTSCTLK